MTANTVRDAFGRLPEELRIQIIKLSPDPWSLWSLTYASPVMGGVLDRYPLEILEVVLDAAVPGTTRRLIYAVLKVRLQRFPASLAEAKEVVRAKLTEVADDMRSFPLDRAAEAVRSLLTTAENVHTWSHACLEHLIQKSMEMRPSTIIKQGGGSPYDLWCIFDNAESRKDYVPQYNRSTFVGGGAACGSSFLEITGVEQLDNYNGQKAIRMHNHMSSMPLDGIPYLFNIPFDPFRKFGFAIWDGKRMTDLGMQSGNPKSKLGNYPFDSFRWWSLLTEEEICLFKELERTRKILECEIPHEEDEWEFW
ncbi:unnamed protein product [Alternaria alternata]